jgi:hypothetical protein
MIGKTRPVQVEDEDSSCPGRICREFLTVLFQRAIDIVLDARWSTLVTVEVESDQQANNRMISVYCSPKSTITDLKEVLSESETLGIPPEEQHITWNDKPMLTQRLPDTPRLFLKLKRVPLDSDLRSLYDMTGLGDWKERDEIIQQMLSPRRAKACPCCNENLIELEPQDAKQRAIHCSVCNGTPWNSSIFICPNRSLKADESDGGNGTGILRQQQQECQFALCLNRYWKCYENDSGREETAQDPYRSLQDMAINIARNVASIACSYGGRGHLCGKPRASCKHELAPKVFKEGPGIILGRQNKALHNGIHVKVLWTDDKMEPGDKQMVLLDEKKPNGMTIQDVIELRRQLKKTSVFQATAEEFFKNENMLPPSYIYEKLKLKQYDMDHAVFELEFDDNYGGDY